MDPACAELIHATAGRWRYRLHSATPIDWVRLDAAMKELLPSTLWTWRLNSTCHSLVLALQPQAPCQGEEARRMGWQALVAAMERAGATSLPPPTLRVVVRAVSRHPHPHPHPLITWLRAPLNWATLGLSLALLGLAAVLAVLGALGLVLPLVPGAPFLLLAFLVAELAFRLRRPFVATAAA